MSESPHASPGPSTKRKRTDASNKTESTNDTAITRSDIWFDDGNIILQAETTQFRVHRGVVGRHSSVFKDMFAMPQPSDEPTIEGCAVVHVTDSPQDWQNILIILYDSSLKAYKSMENLTFSTVKAMLRLGRKYQFDHLRDLAMEFLQTERPNKLELWEKKYKENTTTWFRTTTTKLQNFDLINLLLELDIKSVLPTALYACLEVHTLEEIFRGSSQKHASTVRLVPEAQIILALGKEQILRATPLFVEEWLTTAEGCYEPLVCGQWKAGTLKKVLSQRYPPAVVFSPFLLNKVQNSTTCCSFCKPIMVANIQAGRRKMWDELPGYFGLPTWANLEDI